MNKIWHAEEVTIENLATHLMDAGLLSIATDGDKLWYRTENGIAYSVTVLDDKKFVRLSTYLPLDRDRPKDEKLAFAHNLNAHIFMPVFCLDDEDDLNVSYVVGYQFGMIAAQFSAMVIRFASLLEFLVREQNEDRIIDFIIRGRDTVADEAQDVTDPTVGTEPMVLH
jgi:hypothetical protein